MTPPSFRPHTGPLRDLRRIFAQAVHKAIEECSSSQVSPITAVLNPIALSGDPSELQQIACVSPSRDIAKFGAGASPIKKGKKKKKKGIQQEEVILGEYQCNAALKFAKQTETRPQELAHLIIKNIEDTDINLPSSARQLARSVGLSVSGPGFINIRLSDHWLGECASAVARHCYEASSGKDYAMPTFRDRTKENANVTKEKKHVLVDFASPNMGKELHIGHMRSAVIGDVIANMHDYCGDVVSRVSHVGDWGMPTAIVTTAWLMEAGEQEGEIGNGAMLPSPAYLTSLYRSFKRQLAAETVDKGVYKLKMKVDRVNEILQWCGQAKWLDFIHNQNFQNSEDVSSTLLRSESDQLTLEHIETLVAWWTVCEASREGHREIYERLNVKVDEKGESRYASLVPSVVDELLDANIACESEGAIVAYTNDSKSNALSPDDELEETNEEPPLLVRKSNGAHLYSTVDLATLRWRSMDAEQDLVLYVTDGGQALHFKQVFGVADRAGWLAQENRNEIIEGFANVHKTCVPTHVPFGLVRDERGNKLSSRGGTSDEAREQGEQSNSLRQLLDDGMALVQERVIAPPSLEEEEKQTFFDVLSSASIRYFDLQHQRTTNYNINFDAMLAARGNTAMYLMYTCARIHAMNRKVSKSSLLHQIIQDAFKEDAKEERHTEYIDAFAAAVLIGTEDVSLKQAQERDLALRIAQFDDMLDISLHTYSPHILCEHLHSLALAFNAFYESPECRVLPKQRTCGTEAEAVAPTGSELALAKSRLILCASAASTLHTGMHLIGIPVLESVGFQQQSSDDENK